MHSRGRSIISIAEEFHIGTTQVRSIIQKKLIIRNEWNSGASAMRRVTKTRTSDFQSINVATYQWFLNARQKNVPITGSMLKQKAKQLADEFGVKDFCASNDWLYKFQRRRNITSRLLSGESAGICERTTTEWMHKIPTNMRGISAGRNIQHGWNRFVLPCTSTEEFSVERRYMFWSQKFERKSNISAMLQCCGGETTSSHRGEIQETTVLLKGSISPRSE